VKSGATFWRGTERSDATPEPPIGSLLRMSPPMFGMSGRGVLAGRLSQWDLDDLVSAYSVGFVGSRMGSSQAKGREW
jgi:hypothetical protein